MPVSTECAAALLSFRYPSVYFCFAKKLTRVSLSIVLAPAGPSGSTKLAWAIPGLQDIRASLSLPFFSTQDPNNGVSLVCRLRVFKLGLYSNFYRYESSG